MNINLNTELINSIKEKIISTINVEKIVIFGSRARKDNKYNSDIDIAVWTNDDISILRLELEESIKTLLKFNVVNYYDLPESLKKEIDDDGVIIYKNSQNLREI
jgi:uncharacterized protein